MLQRFSGSWRLFSFICNSFGSEIFIRASLKFCLTTDELFKYLHFDMLLIFMLHDWLRNKNLNENLNKTQRHSTFFQIAANVFHRAAVAQCCQIKECADKPLIIRQVQQTPRSRFGCEIWFDSSYTKERDEREMNFSSKKNLPTHYT